MSAVVSDSSPLNYLALLSDFQLLQQIYRTIVIPPSVYREVVESGAHFPVSKAVQSALGDWITICDPPEPSLVAHVRTAFRLDLGESEAILVAAKLANTPLLMDERRGVQCARARGLVVIRTPLIYAHAKMLGLVGSVSKKLGELRSHGFRLSDQHYNQILRELGE